MGSMAVGVGRAVLGAVVGFGVGCGGSGAGTSSDGSSTTSGAVTSDSADTASSSDTDTQAGGTVVGGVEKGPFILGSEVTFSLLGIDGAPTGQTFPAMVTDDLGTFSAELPGTLASASASGFAFDEVSGQLSAAPVSLGALVVIDAPMVSWRINVLTDLQAERARALVESGVAPTDALAQSAGELVAALPIGAGHVPSHAFEAHAVFGAGSLDDAYVLAVGTTILQAAHDEVGAPAPGDPWPDATAQAQSLLNTLALDLADDGSLEAELVDRLHLAAKHVAVADVLDHLQAYADDVGGAFVAPPLAAMFDTDDDGIDDGADNCPAVDNPDQADADGDGEGDACANCADPSLPDADGDGVREPCDNCPWPNASQVDGDGDGAGNPCDSCPMTPRGEAGPCCDPRDAASWCREPDGNIQNTGCDDSGAGMQCRGLVDLGSATYGQTCLGGCMGFGATCVIPNAFPAWVDPGSWGCAAASSCCSRYCTVGTSCAIGVDVVAQPTCLPYFAAGEAPAGLETLGICVDTTQGPCSVPGTHGRACATTFE